MLSRVQRCLVCHDDVCVNCPRTVVNLIYLPHIPISNEGDSQIERKVDNGEIIFVF